MKQTIQHTWYGLKVIGLVAKELMWSLWGFICVFYAFIGWMSGLLINGPYGLIWSIPLWIIVMAWYIGSHEDNSNRDI